MINAIAGPNRHWPAALGLALTALAAAGCETGKTVTLRVVDVESREGVPGAIVRVHHYSPNIHVSLFRRPSRPVQGTTDTDGMVKLHVYDTATGWNLEVPPPYVGGTVGEAIAPGGTHLPAPRSKPSPDPTVPDVSLEQGQVGDRQYDALILVRKSPRR